MTTPRATAPLSGRLVRQRVSGGPRLLALVIVTAGALWTAPIGVAGRAVSQQASQAQLDEAQQLTERAQELRKSGKYAEASPLAERALSLREQALGPEHLTVADALHLVALLYDDRHEYAKAEAPNLRALAIREKALGPDHPDVALSLFNLAWLAKVKQDFAQAESLYKRTLDIQERALGPDHRDVAATLNDMAVLYNQQGDHDAAIRVNRRVLEMRERTLGVEAPGVALSLNNLARTLELRGEYAEAAAQLQRALTIREKTDGPDHPQTAGVLDGLARIASVTGNFTAAEPLFKRALSIRESRLGPEHPDVGTTLNNLAALYRDMGDNAKAEPLLLRDLAITEKGLGPNHAFVAPTLLNLAGIYAVQGHAVKAEAAYRRSLAIQESALGPTHSAIGTTLNRLGAFLIQARPLDSVEAEPLLERAQTILERAFGPDHPNIAASLNGLGTIALRRGDRDRARAQYARALTVREQALGPTHMDVADSLERLASLARESDTARAIALLSRAYDIRERHLDHNLPLGSERQRIGHLKLFADDTDEALTLARLSPRSGDAIRLALTTTLRRKGRALDATADSVSGLRERATASDRALFDRLADGRSQFAAWTLRGPAGVTPAVYRARLQRLETSLDQLEADLSARSATFRAQTRSIAIDAVRDAIPADAALIEFVRYRPLDQAPAPGGARYAAFVLTRSGDLNWTDLGDAADIDRAVSAWRRALGDPGRVDTRRLARALDATIMQPVRSLLPSARHLLISPDGQLNLIPFAALVDDADRYLVERFTLTYLTSGRDLLRLQLPHAVRSAAVVVASPEYGEPALVPAPASKGSGSTSRPAARVDDSRMFFGPLPGVAEEVRTLRTLLPQATFLVRQDASEAALRRLRGPRILHVATHGFFLGENGASTPAVENPLLKSGLALTGANQGRNGNDDGVLTALEAASLDLWGTKLVVLSACDTGVGQIRNGDGVYGLRRALVLAGAETQLMSLWPVADRSTRDLMRGYYTRLIKGSGRGDALRETQLQLLRDGRHAHPYHWASFIQSGAWTSLEPAR
jgi:CHAT domain-containing protein/Tfp pilus assembly protein PilF